MSTPEDDDLGGECPCWAHLVEDGLIGAAPPADQRSGMPLGTSSGQAEPSTSKRLPVTQDDAGAAR